jgi:lipopolysaccharide biosynthesis protein
MGIRSTVKHQIKTALRYLSNAARLPFFCYNRIRNYDEQLARSSPRYRQGGLEYADKDFPVTKSASACKVVAFFLPQFHRFDVNDGAWGRGFTDWENVARALPVYRGHYQPKLAGEFGYYDLNCADVHARQVETAREAGIYAFCYHHYWFDPQVLMEMPVERHMANFDLPFMLCWANEPWSKRWDGSESELIVPQEYKSGCAERAAAYFSRYFQSRNYVRISGRPAFIIYRTDKIPDLGAFIERFSETVDQTIGVRPYIINALSFESPLADGRGFEKSVYFPPHRVATEVAPIYSPAHRPWGMGMLRKFAGAIYRYEDMVHQQSSLYERTTSLVFPTVCPGWDNTARKPADGNIFMGETIPLFERWIQNATAHLAAHFPPEERILFVNAWNEWAEGAYLEPDRVRGYACLNALSSYCATGRAALNVDQ